MSATTPLLLAASLLLSNRPTTGQCPSGWDTGAGVPGVNDTVYATAMWDPDGPGPQPAQLVVGGRFTTAGGIPANRIAQWNPATGAWSALGSGMDNYVLCLAAMPNGDLVAGGGFATAGGVTARYVARWNGTAWAALGGMPQALSGDVYSLTVMPGGALVAGGIFQFAGFTLVNRVASWDGANWSALSTGMDDHVLATRLMPNGDLVAGGYFTSAGGVAASHVARWNGATWSPLGTGTNGSVFALAPQANGDLVVGGGFQSAGGIAASKVARWDAGAGAWSALGAGTNYDVRAFAMLSGGDLVAGGQFTTAGGGPANYLARWDGSAWSAVGTALNGDVRALTTLPGGGFVAGGNFTAAGGDAAAHFARSCTTAGWTALGSGCAGTGAVPTMTLVSLPELGGTFTLAVSNLGSGLPVMILGLSPLNLPLLPFGLGFGPGCTLFAAPDILDLLVAVAGSSSWSLAIPSAPSLVGLHLWNQVGELDVVSAASNGGEGVIH